MTSKHSDLSEIVRHAGSMRIIQADPPNINAVLRVFPVAAERFRRGVYFCYGDAIYNPSGHPIEKQLIAHEACHSLQQADIGVVAWWDRYLTKTADRLEFELEAHRVEYAYYASMGMGRPFRRRYLAACAERLSGPLYGRMLKKPDAKRLISQEDEQ